MKAGRVPIKQIRIERKQKIFLIMKELNIYDKVINNNYGDVLQIVDNYAYFGNKKSNYNNQREAIEDIKRVFFLCDNTNYKNNLFEMMLKDRNNLNYEQLKNMCEFIAMKEYITNHKNIKCILENIPKCYNKYIIKFG
jgi:hypothetical protein